MRLHLKLTRPQISRCEPLGLNLDIKRPEHLSPTLKNGSTVATTFSL